ncbi:MAG: hypothetical protein R2724_14275 [Bryobacterales bacterium]
MPFTTMTRNNPETIDETDNIAITITGVPPDRAGELKNAVDTLLAGWTYSSTASDTWVLKMTPSALAQLKSDTLTQSMATIENRINGLGLTEPVIQQHGRADSEHEILVQLPGVSDPARGWSCSRCRRNSRFKKCSTGRIRLVKRPSPPTTACCRRIARS